MADKIMKVAGEINKPPISWMLVGNAKRSVVISDKGIHTEFFKSVGEITQRLTPIITEVSYDGVNMVELHNSFENDNPKCKECKAFLDDLRSCDDFGLFHTAVSDHKCNHCHPGNFAIKPMSEGDRVAKILGLMESLTDHEYLFGAVEYYDTGLKKLVVKVQLYPMNFNKKDEEDCLEVITSAVVLCAASDNQKIHEIELSHQTLATLKVTSPPAYEYITTN